MWLLFRHPVRSPTMSWGWEPRGAARAALILLVQESQSSWVMSGEFSDVQGRHLRLPSIRSRAAAGPV